MSQQTLSRTVLLVTYYFPPHATPASLRAAYVAQLLAEREWNVVVLHADLDAHDNRNDRWAEEFDRIGVRRVSVPPSRRRFPSFQRSSFARLQMQRWLHHLFHMDADYYAGWVPAALHAAERIVRTMPINIVVGSAPPLSAAIAAEAIARQWNIPFAVDFGDTLELIPYYGPSYATRVLETTVQSLLRSALYASVVSRREKEYLLRRYDFLTHEEVGILPHPPVLLQEDVSKMERSALLIVANEMPMFLLRPFLKLLQRQRQQLLRIVGGVPPSLGKVLQKMHLADRVVVENTFSSHLLDRWIAGSEATIAFATRWCTTPGSVVHRLAGAGKPLVVVGDIAEKRAAELPSERAIIVHKVATSTIDAALTQLPLLQTQFPPTDDHDLLEREFSRRLGMVMKL